MGEHCKSDILKKIASNDAIDGAAVQKMLNTLCEENFINESRYAAAFARDKSSIQGWGEVKIRIALRQKAIEEDVINEALESIDCDASQKRLTTLMNAKLRALHSEENEQTKRLKLFKYLLGRGYNYEIIKKIYDNIRTN